MPPKSKAKNQLILKAKRQSSIYFLLLVVTDTYLTLKSQIVETVNKSGGLRINDDLVPLKDDKDSEIQPPTIGGNDDSSDEEDGDDTDDTAPMITSDSNIKQISIEDITLGLLDPISGEISELDITDNTKINQLNWKDFTTLVFKIPGEEFQIFGNEYGI